MRVKYPKLWLAGDPGDTGRPRSSETKNLRPQPDFLVQWIEALRAPNATPVDRYNDRITIEFDVARSFSSIAKAESFFLTHYVTLRKQAGDTITFILEDHAEIYALGALVKVQPVGAIGVSLELHYTVMAGALVTTLAGSGPNYPPGQ